MSSDGVSANFAEILKSSSYRVAYKDLDFLTRDELRGTRLLLEYNKVERILNEHGIEDTIIMFGSARVNESDHNYRQARILASLIGKNCSEHTTICSGGGPGIMEAVNRGAYEAGAKSIGLNIDLPHEQMPNKYVSPQLCFRFHYFAIRKMHFLRRARALIAFPGGFGTLDEVFESLTLFQTKRMAKIPIILFNRDWWEKVINFQALIDSQTISEQDLKLFDYAHDAHHAWDIIKNKTGVRLKRRT